MKKLATYAGVVFIFLISLCSVERACADDVSTPILRAAEVARIDFEKKLKQEEKYDWEFATYVADINNYSIGLSESRDNFIVVFVLKKTKAKILGGGAMYKVSKKTLEISEFSGFEQVWIGSNTYAYVYGNPIMYVDLLGLEGAGVGWTPEQMHQLGAAHGKYQNEYSAVQKRGRSNYLFEFGVFYNL